MQDIDTKRVVFLCRDDRATGDCLGPLVSSRLKVAPRLISRTLETPVHAANLQKHWTKYLIYTQPFV